jgi:hypothetical protein
MNAVEGAGTYENRRADAARAGLDRRSTRERVSAKTRRARFGALDWSDGTKL